MSTKSEQLIQRALVTVQTSEQVLRESRDGVRLLREALVKLEEQRKTLVETLGKVKGIER